jgi:ribosome-associated toxin RatA of RatAB toxin-antitoxin module
MIRHGASNTRIQRSAQVPFSASRMFDLVADIESYPSFLPWCRGAHVVPHGDCEVEATLEIAKGPLRKSFTTRNRLHPGRRIDLQLVAGPFRHLEGHWVFEDLGDSGARVSLELDFDVGGALLRRTLGPVFNEIAGTMVDAFCRRARSVYGARSA